MSTLLALVLTVAATAAPVKPAESRYGKVLFDSRGYSLYAFTADRRSLSRCYGACAKAWPPYLVKRKPTGKLLGITMRRDGSHQLTFAGKPLYHYVGDTRSGQILCQNVREYGGLWLVVAPDGSYVR
jgi:predicted lipoprotein with Yx(FWY)xxD motif